MKDGEPDRAVGTVAVFAVTLLLIFAGFSVLWHWKWMIDCLVSAVFVFFFWKYHKSLNISVF
ncbi:hypothetical protein GF351_03750, partial [Candidatus Woesearchaeota archaeon]|nr:hypothetical protein [Candidatus Woesearchaeota archaeon]